MNKEEWNNFKNNSIKHVWTAAHGSWIHELFPTPIMDFFEKFKNGKNRYNDIQKLRFFLKKKPIMPTLEYVVTTKCTMNCKYCNTFIPYFSDKSHVKPVKFETFKKDIDVLLNSIDYIYAFGLVGGEPMLDSELPEMIEYVLSKKQIKHIFLATNCTILPDEKLLKIMKNKKFAVQISDYRNVENIKGGVSVKYNEFKRLMIENGINISNIQEKQDANSFQTMPELYKDKQDSDKVKNMYEPCWGRYCNMLCDGIFSQCTLSIYINRNLELSEEIKDEIIDIRNVKSSKDLTNQLIEFYSHPYSAFCHYCHMENIKYGLPCGEQVKIEEV